jgi:hypothetical protein
MGYGYRSDYSIIYSKENNKVEGESRCRAVPAPAAGQFFDAAPAPVLLSFFPKIHWANQSTFFRVIFLWSK